MDVTFRFLINDMSSYIEFGPIGNNCGESPSIAKRYSSEKSVHPYHAALVPGRPEPGHLR